MKKDIISSFDADIVCISETHLETNQSIDLPGYNRFQNNRQYRQTKAVKTSRGVCILTKMYLTLNYDISIADSSYDGIIAICMKHKVSDFSFVIVCVYIYISPEQSIWGKDSLLFFSHLLSIIYDYNDSDYKILCGNFNAINGDMKDFVLGVDNITYRTCIDSVKGGHYKDFIDFLIESKMCLVNGRINSELQNFTSISEKRSLSLIICVKFIVHTVIKLLNDLKLQTDKVLDHSILELHYVPHNLLPMINH